MTEEPPKTFIEIVGIHEFSRLNKELKRDEFYLVDYLLNGEIPGAIQLKKSDYTKERVLDLAIALEKTKHPDTGEVVSE